MVIDNNFFCVEKFFFFSEWIFFSKCENYNVIERTKVNSGYTGINNEIRTWK